MPQRTELIAEAQELMDEFREIAGQTPAPEDLNGVGIALGRVMESLETQSAHEAVEQAAAEIASARETLARVRRALER